MFCSSVSAQNTLAKTDDIGRIAVAAYVPQQVEPIAPQVMTQLANKIGRAITENGMGSTDISRFLIVPTVNVIQREMQPSAPPMIALSIDITFAFGDNETSTLYSSCTKSLKGLGTTETKAYIAAINRLRADDAEIVAMIESGKQKIIEYYNSQIDFILKQAEAQAANEQYDDAIATLMRVPDVCKDAYAKAMEAVQPIVQKKIDVESAPYYNNAKHIWNSAQNDETAREANNQLSNIHPLSVYADKGMALSEEIAQFQKAVLQREYELRVQQHQDSVTLARERMQAEREIEEQRMKYEYDAALSTATSRINAAKEIAAAYATVANNVTPETGIKILKQWW